MDFVSEIDCVATSYMDQEEIREMVFHLGKLKELHDLDVCDVRVQRLMVQEDRMKFLCCFAFPTVSLLHSYTYTDTATYLHSLIINHTF